MCSTAVDARSDVAGRNCCFHATKTDLADGQNSNAGSVVD